MWINFTMTEKNGRVLSVVNTRRPRRTLPVKLGVNKGVGNRTPRRACKQKLLPRAISIDPGRQQHLRGF